MQCASPYAGVMPERNLLLTLRYDGTNYHGWQIQKNARSVQQVFQEALYPLLGETPEIKGCSRTDTGVHANRYCVSFRTFSRLPVERLQAALNHMLPEDIAVLDCQEVPSDFHARYSCRGKEYQYKIWNASVRDPFLRGYVLHYPYALDEQLLHCAAQDFCGTHDFSSFCSSGSKKQNNTRTVFRCSFAREGALVIFTTAADGYLYNMVRIMVGTLLRISQGKLSPDALPAILAARSRSAAGPTAPACGLYLNQIFYGDNDYA